MGVFDRVRLHFRSVFCSFRTLACAEHVDLLVFIAAAVAVLLEAASVDVCATELDDLVLFTSAN